MKSKKCIVQKNCNKQTTIVNLKCSSKKRSCRKKKRHLVHKLICGRIFQKCDSPDEVVYFQAYGIRTSTSIVRVENQSDCTMTAIISQQCSNKPDIEQIINPHQQIALIVPSISSLKIKCDGENQGFCKGKFVISLRYKRSR